MPTISPFVMARASGQPQSVGRPSAGVLTSMMHQDVSFESFFAAQESDEGVHLEISARRDQACTSACFDNETILSYLLRACNDVRHGMLLHHYMALKEIESSPFLDSHLLHMYFRCNSSENGFALSSSMRDLNVYSWNYLMEEYLKHEKDRKLVELYLRMQEESSLPNKITFFTIIKALAHQPSAANISRIHSCISNSELGQDEVLCTALLRTYGAGSHMIDVTKVFELIVRKDVILWTTMINLYAGCSQINEALQLYEQMHRENINPSTITYVSVISMCAKHEALDECKIIYNQIIADVSNPDITLGNSLVSMYEKCASVDDACYVFEKMPEKNVIAWTCMIKLYARKGYGKAALAFFSRLQIESILPNQFTLIEAIVACACIAALEVGKNVHTQLYEIKGVSVVAGATLVNMYDKCDVFGEAEKVFGMIAEGDLILWNVMISAYIQHGKILKAIQLLEGMFAQDTFLDQSMLTKIFSLFATCSQKVHGDWVLAYILECSLDPKLISGNVLLYMYAQVDDLEHSAHIFDNLVIRDVVSWTVMIAAYMACGQSEHAMKFFEQMHQEGQLPDKRTCASVLESLGSSCSQTQFKQVHAQFWMNGFLDSSMEVQAAFITLCGKWGNDHDAESIFKVMQRPDVVTWNAMMSLYSNLGEADKVVELFKQMIKEEIRPNAVTFVRVLSACDEPSFFMNAKLIHMWAVSLNLQSDNSLGTALVTMYGEFGSIEDARKCFDIMGERNLLSWNGMMLVYSQHCKAKEVIELFQQMLRDNSIPDSSSFLTILGACKHSNLVNEAKRFFTLMVKEYDIVPTVDHYGCLKDLFERSEQFDEFQTFLQSLSLNCNLQFFSRMGESFSEKKQFLEKKQGS